MKKSLIALAIAGVFAAPVAMAAETTVYGQANISYDAVNNGDNGSGSTNNSGQANHVATKTISSNTSRLGFKGSEDLGDGVSAIWQIEEQVNFDASTNTPVCTNSAAAALPKNAVSCSNSNVGTFSPRDTFAGLSSADIGTVIAGVHDVPYKMATRGFDLFGDGVADNRSIMGGAGLHDARLGNAVAYIAPAFSGLTLALATVAGAEIPSSAINPVPTKGDAWSFAALYSGVPGLNVNFGWQTVTLGTAGTGTLATDGVISVPKGLFDNNPGSKIALTARDRTNAWKLGGSYAIDDFQVNAIYEKLSYMSGGTDLLAQSNWYLAGKYNLDAMDAVKVAYTSAGQQSSTLAGVYGTTAAKTTANQITFGFDHGLSKHTTIYALYTRINNQSGAAYVFNQGTSAADANGGAGSDPSIISMGMKHSF